MLPLLYIAVAIFKDMRTILIAVLLVISLVAAAQGKDEQKIKEILGRQTAAWNRGDIEGFMQTYWKSDSLMFIGKNGVKYGWQATLDNYRKSYPDKTAMGQLSFDILAIKKISPHYYYLVGKWMLKRTIGDLQGHFDLLIKRVKGEWKIVADHSS